MDKLRWINGQYLREMPLETLYPLVEPCLIKSGLLPTDPEAEQRAFALECLRLEQEKARIISEYPALLSFFFRDDFDYEEDVLLKWLRPAPSHVRGAFQRQLELTVAADPATLNSEFYEAQTRAIAAELGVGAGKVIHPTRVAMSGRS